MTDPIRVGGTSAGVAIMPGLGGQTVVGGCKVKYRSSHPIQIKFGSLMRLTIVYVCAKFHKNRFNS